MEAIDFPLYSIFFPFPVFAGKFISCYPAAVPSIFRSWNRRGKIGRQKFISIAAIFTKTIMII